MAVIIDNPNTVEAPAPGQLRYGIFRTATVTDDLDSRGISAGFTFPAEDCGTSYLYDAMCAPGDAEEKIFDEGTPYMEALPYWIYSTRQCGMVGRTATDMAASVRRRLAGGEQTQVEAAFWGGTAVAVDPNLTGTAGVVTVAPAAPGAGAAISALEESFYSEYGYVGTIHVNQAATGALAYAQLLNASTAGVLRTPLGSAVSLGAGYGTAGPAGVAPAAGFVWAFMTPPVVIRRSEVISQDSDVRSVMDREFNQFMGLAERVYAHTWTCPVVHAVQVPIAAPAVSDTPAVPA